jgi:diguanylate cyclase (GGDEF)-like protein/PAS domain S-box-containing protein
VPRKSNWFYLHFTLLYGLLMLCPQVHGQSIDVAKLTNKPAGLTDKLRFASSQACPDANFKTIIKCGALQYAKQNALNFGFLNEKYWFVFSLNNSASVEKQVYVEVAYALLDKVHIKGLDETGAIRFDYLTGDMLPYNMRPVKYPTYVFPVQIDAKSSVDFRLLVETGSSMQVPIYIWQPENFIASKSIEILIFGLFIGAMVVMTIYNFLLFLSTREKSYLYLTGTVFFYALIQSDLTGISFAYLWPHAPNWNDNSLIIVSNFAIICLSLFSSEFLRLDEQSVYTRNLLSAGNLIALLWIALTPFVAYQHLIVGTACTIALIPLIAYAKGIKLWLTGYVPARYFVFAFTLFVVATSIFALNKAGIIDRNIFTEYFMNIGAMAVVSLLSLALADRVNQEKHAKEAAQNSAIISLRKFEDIYNNSSEGIFQLDAQGQFLAVNPAFLKIMKIDSLTQLKGSFRSIDSMSIKSESGLLATAKLQGQLRRNVVFLRVDGSQFWAVLNIRVVENPTEEGSLIEGSIIDITELKENERQLRYLANYDQLTGLINRHAFQERLRRLIESAHQYSHEHSLLYIDLDRFKLVNDTCGHIAGDELLKQLSVIFTHKVRQRDATARIGGDEFAILLESCEVQEATRIGEELKRELNKFKFNWQGKQFDVGASIGIVPINQYSESVVSLLNLADSVCLMAKEQGRNRIVVHDENAVEVNEKIRAKNLLATIHEAIDNNDFILFKQPIVSLNEINFKSFEVLLRLQLNDEIVGPGVFIPNAERYNVMGKIDRWVVKEFVYLLSKNPDMYNEIDMATLNLSGQTLSNTDFLPFLLNLLGENPKASKKLCFELTESTALNNLSESSGLVMEMKQLGVRFAVDDFGSGYASYNYLTQLPVDFVKIDGSFSLDIHENPVNQAIVRSITEISHMMKMQVIAEFVERKEEWACLKEIGVDMVQGYYMGKPSRLVKRL